jgi:hypothetical protein
MAEWLKIKVKFPNKCVLCGEQIDIDDDVYWKKGKGLKHYPECTIGFRESDSRLIIFDENDDFKDMTSPSWG